MSWYERAACLGLPTEWFFPGPGQAQPRHVCQACAVRRECVEEELRIEAGSVQSLRHGYRASTPAERVA